MANALRSQSSWNNISPFLRGTPAMPSISAMFESAKRSVIDTTLARQGQNLNLGHADHGIPPHERRQLLFAPVARVRRSFREN